MDRDYIEREHIVDRYLSGELTVREARAFEQYCREHPGLLKEMPIPVRLKARLSRRPLDGSETGMFEAIPSGATHATMQAADEGFEPEEYDEPRRWRYGGGKAGIVIAALGLALLAAVAGLVMSAMRAGDIEQALESARQELTTTKLQAPSGVQTHRIRPVRARPEQATLAPGWPIPPQLLELRIDVTEGRHTQFQLTIDKLDGGRVLQIRRIARDSNRELRLGLNSSAFGPGEYLIKIDGYTWRGQTQEVGWLRLDLR